MQVLMGLAVFCFAVVMRLSMIWRGRRRGCDAYYFLFCASEFRRTRRLPITLPNVYVLEEREQWYPPGFSVLLSWIPERLLDKYYWAVSLVLDGLVAALAYLVGYMAWGNVWVSFLVGVVYALNSASIIDCTSLNSRPLGALLFNACWLCIIAFFVNGYSLWYILGAFTTGFALLMTHKLSAQLFCFLVPFTAIVLGHWTVLLLGIGIVFVAYFFSRGFLLKIWRGQWDILNFWRKQWSKLGAHQVYGSTMYEFLSHLDSHLVHGQGWKGFLKSVSYMGMNPFVLMMVYPIWHYQSLFWDRWLLWWAVGAYLLAALTQFVPFFRFVGEGYRYLKLAALPICYLAFTPIVYGWDDWRYYVLLTVTVILGIWLYVRLYRFMSNARATTLPFMDDGLGKAVKYLNAVPTNNILCLTEGLGDAIGYYCRKSVLRGSHNVHLNTILPMFPVLKLPVEYLAKWSGASHVVLSKMYASAEHLGLSPAGLAFASGDIEVYSAEGIREPVVTERRLRAVDRTSFGFEWTKFSDVFAEYEANFLSYIGPVTKEFFKGKLVLDAGCGAGRHAFFAAKYGAKVVAFDISHKAVAVAKENVKDLPNAEVVQADIYNTPADWKGKFAYVFCLGVLHHLVNPQEGFNKLVPLLEDGGTISIWVYGRKDNKLAMYLYEPFRKITTRIPHTALYYLTYPLAMVVEVCNRLKLPFLRYYAGFPFKTKWNDVFDMLSAPSAKYYTPEEVETWFVAAGLKSISVSYRVLGGVAKGIKGFGVK